MHSTDTPPTKSPWITEGQLEQMAVLSRHLNNLHDHEQCAASHTFRPGGRIANGNVIVDPLLPHRVLVGPDPHKPLLTETATEKNWQLCLETKRGLSFSIWAIFLEKISVKAGPSHMRVKNGQFTMQSLETQSLRDEPSDEYIAALCGNPKVKEFLRLDSLLFRPVYVVTGLKIAKGFRLSGTEKHESSLTAKASAEVALEVSLGTGADSSSSVSISNQFESGNDIIFAYQLMMIKPKGWTKEMKLVTSDFRKHALLSDHGHEPEKEVEAERGVLAPNDLEDSDGGVRLVNLEGDGAEGVCVVYKET
ncbi:hypothetical protein TOPH_06217 [Tolypocladium ophioglossoides CBS 100239]|uniref:Uncharacterized protein n=1 Tax=Tolypocladium ophioglossoides (strain CBS 100239) TaxID=1163406 RepID=A0A0L0N4Z0_TOLOC|nr:hypothetical protein TOPH_06217 [Tolypocladium ophioglossoides CBS 100239]